MDKPGQLDENTTARECNKTTALIMDSISEAALMSPWATPRMQDMFVEWVEIIDRRMIGNPDMPGRIDIDAKADGVGISGSTLPGMLLYLQRRGSISITDVGVAKGNGRSEYTCSCNKG
ncbi:MAG: hypothetical protein STSR0007_12000 [Thermovirga sp.]